MLLAYADLPLLGLARYFKKDDFRMELAVLCIKRNRTKVPETQSHTGLKLLPTHNNVK